MVEIIRTDSGCEDFKELVRLLDLYLAEKDGDDHSFYDQYNSIDKLNNVVLVYKDGLAVACGAVKEYSTGVMEVKRMYTRPEFRGQKIASKVLQELEKWSLELGYHTCILETGRRQEEAVGLYQHTGYTIIPNYGQYQDVAYSLCFEKKLIL
ncbi:MAG: GNAT family N-acetyltransferase [Ferruginibacter sp.]|nr:GNAT family N-acetyltransferase [Ferruginibacter sp.]